MARPDDHSQDTAGRDTFPASDPTSSTAHGARAVDVNGIRAKATPISHDAVTLDARFPSAEAAKLALEGLVRDAPMDRRAAEIIPGDNATTLRVTANPADADRLRGLLNAAAA